MKEDKNLNEADWSVTGYIINRFNKIAIGESISQAELFESAKGRYDKFTKQYFYVLVNQLIKTRRIKRCERFSKNPLLTKLQGMPETWSYITYELRGQQNISGLEIVRTSSPLLNFDFTLDAPGSTIFKECAIQPIQFIISTQINSVGAMVLRNVIKATLYEPEKAKRELEKAMHLLHVANTYKVSFALNAGVYKLAEETINEYVEKESLTQEMKGFIIDLYESEWESALDTIKKFYSGEWLIKVNKE